jgi:hypothetical protein
VEILKRIARQQQQFQQNAGNNNGVGVGVGPDQAVPELLESEE